ncbi:MAG: hypothetical protein PUC33_01265, partial [Oscillospiraceae bacterium]|nr:hypothetical protein [Oscillospiraceae bacterium]
TCTTAGLEKRVCANDITHVQTRDIPATGHTAETIIGTPATCESDGLSDGEKCAVCGEILVTQVKIPAKGHTYGEWNELLPATCQERGFNARVCLNCGTMDREIIPVQDHKDDDGDDYCDWCGSFVGEVPDFPDIDDCSCNCHKGGLAGFFFRLINFFQKLFGQNKVCACGASH